MPSAIQKNVVSRVRKLRIVSPRHPAKQQQVVSDVTGFLLGDATDTSCIISLFVGHLIQQITLSPTFLVSSLIQHVKGFRHEFAIISTVERVLTTENAPYFTSLHGHWKRLVSILHDGVVSKNSMVKRFQLISG